MWPPGNMVGWMPRAAASAVEVQVAGLAGGLLADAHHDPGGGVAEGFEIGSPAGGRTELVQEEVVLVGRLLRSQLAPERVLEGLLRHHDVGVGQELPPGRDAAAGSIGGDDARRWRRAAAPGPPASR